ncbi:hypothetical protein GOP47_0030034 [Adiantum capillus-veneris]|nr:hypothetical protein GOP47_0030034 [Adiantum capillus-veneris]
MLQLSLGLHPPLTLPCLQAFTAAPSGAQLCSPEIFTRWTTLKRKDLCRLYTPAYVLSPSSTHEASVCEDAIARLVAIVGDNAPSSLGQATWEEVMQHTAQRLKWANPGFDLVVVNEKVLSYEEGNITDKADLHQADIWVVIGVNDIRAVNWISRKSISIRNMLCFDSSPDLRYKLKGQVVSPKAPLTRFLATLPGSETKEMLQVLSLVEQAWSRRNSDDIRFMLLILIDKYITPVESLKNLRAQDLNTLKCMLKNCSSQILACLANASCRKAISCLNKCAPTDQVCSYQCIVSYESSELEAFSLCVLQKHNCLGLTSEIPSQPDVKPMKLFRSALITHDVADDIFVGWLGKLQWSWRVVAGQNPAYDQFPCQFQIFYRGAAKGSMWYDPVFRVKTLDGRLVWRRRHYKVKRGDMPGTFHFSVLDNGVVSKEYWRIVDATDDLSWGLFFYSGAAAAAGQSYTGAVLVTPDGKWPAKSEENRLRMALEECGIKDWELYSVNNASCEGPPLGLPEDAPEQVTSLWT